MAEPDRWSGADLSRPVEGVTSRRIDQGDVTYVRYRFDPGASFPLHRHPGSQTVVVLRGECRFRSGGETFDLTSDDLVFTPSMEPHGIDAGKEGVELINVITPRRTEDNTEYLEEP